MYMYMHMPCVTDHKDKLSEVKVNERCKDKNWCQLHWLIDWFFVWLIDWLIDNSSTSRTEIFKSICRRHHCQWRAAKFSPRLDAQSLWAVWIFIVPHLLSHGTSIFPVSSERPPILSPLTTHREMWGIYSYPDPHRSPLITGKWMLKTYSYLDPHEHMSTLHWFIFNDSWLVEYKAEIGHTNKCYRGKFLLLCSHYQRQPLLLFFKWVSEWKKNIFFSFKRI
jgi:hypothetical protein